MSHHIADDVTFQINVDRLTLSKQLSERDIRVTIRVGEVSKITCSGKLSEDQLTITWNHPFLLTAPSSAEVTIAICALPKKFTPTWDKQPMGQDIVTNVTNLLDSGNVWICNVPRLYDGPTTLSMTCRASAVLIAPASHDCVSTLMTYSHRLYWFSREFRNMASLFTEIELEQALLDLCPKGHERHIEILNNLAVSYSMCYDMQGNLSDLNRAIEIAEKQLDLCPLGHLGHAAALGELASLLRKLYQIQGNQADLSRIVLEMDQKRLDLCPSGHKDHAKALGNLAASFQQSYNVQGNVADLMKAIEMMEKRLELCPFGHTDHVEALSNLSASVAIELDGKSLELCPPGHPDHGLFLYNLATSFSASLLKEAVAIHSVQHQRFALIVKWLAHTLLQMNSQPRSQPSGQPSSEMEDAFQTYKLLKHCGPAASLNFWNTSQDWIKDAENYDHSSVLEAYQTSLNILDHFTSLYSSVDSRHQVLQARVVALANDAFSCAVRNGNFQLAVELLEQGRGILWSQLARFDISLATLESRGRKGHELVNRFTALSTSLKHHAQGSGGNANEPYWRVREEWQFLVDEIRSQEGFSRFLLPPHFDDLQRAAEHGPVIVVNASEYGCDAMIVHSSQHELTRIRNETDMPLDRVTFETITGADATIEGAIQAFKDHRWVHLACHGAQHAERPFESWFYQKMFEQPALDFEYAATALNFAVRHSLEVSLEKRIVFAHIGI
ncbi:hypothetical protein JVU11DRAFT_7345 [Chiua virens]|nr:hypothetical protein JVU11DRAFT_7345 [Chiua virens]